MRAAIYARVSTSDKDQNPETQLWALRAFIQAQGWQAAGEYVDEASATDLRGRARWRALLDAASRRQIDLVVCWKLDRCFRSVLDANTTLQNLKRWGVGLRSYTEPMIDTASGSPWSEMLFNLMATFAQFERGLISERTRAGMARARAQGKHVGRPRKRGGPGRAPRAPANQGVLYPERRAGEGFPFGGRGVKVLARTIPPRNGSARQQGPSTGGKTS